MALKFLAKLSALVHAMDHSASGLLGRDAQTLAWQRQTETIHTKRATSKTILTTPRPMIVKRCPQNMLYSGCPYGIVPENQWISREIWHTDPRIWHTNLPFTPYEPFLFGVGGGLQFVEIKVKLLGDAPEQFKARHALTISFSQRFARLIFWSRA